MPTRNREPVDHPAVRMKVPVTGASGLIGAAVCAGLMAEGHEVVGVRVARAFPRRRRGSLPSVRRWDRTSGSPIGATNPTIADLPAVPAAGESAWRKKSHKSIARQLSIPRVRPVSAYRHGDPAEPGFYRPGPEHLRVRLVWTPRRTRIMNTVIYLIGLVVVVLAILSFLGLH